MLYVGISTNLKGRHYNDVKHRHPKHDAKVLCPRCDVKNCTCPGWDIKMPRPAYDVTLNRHQHDVKDAYFVFQMRMYKLDVPKLPSLHANLPMPYPFIMYSEAKSNL